MRATITTDAQLLNDNSERGRPLLSALLERSAEPARPTLGRPKLVFSATKVDAPGAPASLLLVVRAHLSSGSSAPARSAPLQFLLKQTSRGLLISELKTQDGSLP